MTVVSLRQPALVRRPFYLVMALLIAAVFVAGFSTTVPGDFAPKPGLPLLLHLHGAIFTLWVLLFVAQPAFISRGSLALHRKVGWVGVGLVVTMVVMGEAATYFSIRNNREVGIFPSGVFLVMNGVGILVFAAIVGAGVALRRQAEWHKRLMLIAAVSILGPALGRLFGTLGFGASTGMAVTGVTFAFALAGPTADLIVRRRVHPAYAWGIGAVLVTDVLIGLLGFSPPVLAAVRAIKGG